MPSLTDGRGMPLGECRVWFPGQGDPFLSHRESAWYDTGSEGFVGAASYSGGEPTVEYLGDRDNPVGLVCRPRVVLQDTAASDYTLTGGAWEERRPATGAPRVTRLVQGDAAPGRIWRAESRFALPAQPNVALSLAFVDTPPDWDDLAYPPYVGILFGNEWGLEFSKQAGARLMRRVGGNYVPVRDLPEPQAPGNADNAECLILLRTQRGKIGISTDGGRGEYAWFPGTVAGAPITVLGQGGMCVFGLHQLQMVTGLYTSPERHARVKRPAGTPLLILPRGDEAFGSVATADLSAPLSARAQYSLELTPQATMLSTGWEVYRSPEVHAVTSRYAAIQSSTGFTGASFVLPDLLEVTVEKPRDLDGAGGTALFRLDPDQANYWNQGDWPKFELRLGHELEDGSGEVLETVLKGFISEVRVVMRRHREAVLQVTLTTVAERFRQAKWNRLDSFPLGGRSLNQALDLILETEGLAANESYRQWDFVDGYEWGGLGDRILLPLGSPEDPFEWPRPGESKWATMQRLAGYAGLEVVPLDNGILTTLPKGYFPPVVSATYQATPEAAEQLQRLVLALAWRRNSREKATSILVDGRDENDQPIFAFAQDDAAEQNPGSPRFSPFRVEICDSVDGTTTPGLLALRAAELAREYFREPIGVDLEHPVDLTLSRRLRVRIAGFEVVGLDPLYDFQIVTLSHRYDAEGKFGPEVTTTAGLEAVV